ncbi:MAG: substrate-binding domain-containing protein [Dorea sp.]|jgi:ribose transport system substrate-binding protein|nr:substrate-binding domain-containing protein [Dorea sp.]
MKKRWMAALLSICMAALAGACAAEPKEQEAPVKTEKKETPEEAAERMKQAKLEIISPSAYGNIDGLDVEPATYFSVIGKGGTQEYWQMVKAGAEAAVSDLNKELNYTGGDKIKVVYSGPADADNVDEQVNILDEELARYPSALGISIIDSQSCNVQFDLAVQNGIPIITFDSVSSYQGIMANISTDNKKASSEAAAHMAEELEEEGRVLILAHDSRAITCRERAESFAQELKESYPDISVTEIYYMDRLDELRERIVRERAGLPAVNEEEDDGENPEQDDAAAEKELQDAAVDESVLSEEAVQAVTDEEVYQYILEKNPDIKGVFGTNGQAALKMVSLCEEMEMDDVVIIGYDADKEEIEALRDGKIFGLVVQNPYGMGYAAVVAEARCVLESGNEAEIDTGYIWVTAENLDRKETQQMLYTK